MKLIKLVPIVLSLVTIACTSGHEKNTSIDLKEKPVPVESVQNITGFFGSRMELNRDKYLKNFPINKYVYFVVKREHTGWDWTQAEQHGKWIESAYLSAIQSGDEELLKKAQGVLERIINSQEESGYLGATAKSFRSAERPIRGMDPYELYFVFHAFMTVYEETGDEKALTAVKGLAGYFLDNFGPGKNEFWPSDLRPPGNKHAELAGVSKFAGHSVHYSWEGTLLADPIARLYEITHDQQYLDWSKWVISNIDKWSGWDSFSRLDSVADGTLGVDDLQPYVHSHTFHMNFMGFLRMYQITGDESYLRKVKGAWEDICKRQMYITGGVSVAEHYEHDYVKPLSGNIVETCATMSWMQLTQMLLEITGEVKYADAIEQLMINHVFAAQESESGVCRYHTAPNGAKPEGCFHGPDCCTASGHRIISLIPTFLYAENNDNFYINQYLGSQYNGDDFAFEIDGNYPESEHFEIKVTSEKTVHKVLNLRMPAWCLNPVVKVNGKTVGKTKSGSYLTLDENWKKGDVISMYFPMQEQWLKRKNHSEYSIYYLPGGEHMYKETPTDHVPYAFMRGPIVYALDMVWNENLQNDKADLSTDIHINTELIPEEVEKPNTSLLGPIYQTNATFNGKNVEVKLVPFANIGQWYREGEPKPDKYSKAFTYGIWLYK